MVKNKAGSLFKDSLVKPDLIFSFLFKKNRKKY